MVRTSAVENKTPPLLKPKRLLPFQNQLTTDSANDKHKKKNDGSSVPGPSSATESTTVAGNGGSSTLRSAASLTSEVLMGRGGVGFNPARDCDAVIRDVRQRTAKERVRITDLFKDFDRLQHGVCVCSCVRVRARACAKAKEDEVLMTRYNYWFLTARDRQLTYYVCVSIVVFFLRKAACMCTFFVSFTRLSLPLSCCTFKPSVDFYFCFCRADGKYQILPVSSLEYRLDR